MNVPKEAQLTNHFFSKKLMRKDTGKIDMDVYKYNQAVRLILRYQINIKHQFKSQLFLHLVNTTNRCFYCPFILTVINKQSSTSLQFALTNLLEINQNQMITEQSNPNLINIHQYMEQSIQPLFEIFDSVYKKIVQMVDKFTIRESIYPKQHDMIAYLRQIFLESDPHMGQLNQKLKYFVTKYTAGLSSSSLQQTSE